MSIYLNTNKKNVLVGLTGGIGSGKSVVGKIFSALNVPVFNSDDQAKDIVNTNQQVISAIKNCFGDVYENNRLNNALLANVVFNDKEKLKQLNAIVHPAVGERFKKWVDYHATAPILIKEAAILIESGAYKELDKIILVSAPEEVRLSRVMKRDKTTEQAIKKRMDSQMTDEEKKGYADYIVLNNEELIIPQIIDIYNKLKSHV